MIVYTFQSPERYEELVRDGVIRGCWKKSKHVLDSKEFKAAYSWLVAQYNKRVGRLRHLPIWVSLQPPSEIDMANLKDCVLLTCEIPEEKMLKLDSTNWYWVLWDSPFVEAVIGKTEYDKYGENPVYDKEYERLNSNRKLKRASWEGIFDLELGRQDDMYIGSEAIVPELCLEDVIEFLHVPKVTLEEHNLIVKNAHNKDCEINR